MRNELKRLYDIHNILNSNETRITYNNYRKQYREKLKTTRIHYNKKCIDSADNKTSAMWRIINSSRNKYLKNNCDNTNNCDISCDHFNKYFTTIATNLTSQLSEYCDDPIQLMSDNCPLMSSCPIDSFEFTEISSAVLREIIDSLKNSNSTDFYNLNVIIIKTVKDIIISPLTKLINFCIRYSIFPNCLKIASVIPIYKKGDRTDPNNYRPISLLPIFSKIMEKVLSKQLYNYFERHKLFSETQFGFRSGRSTTEAILSLIDHINNGFENNNYVVANFLDLTKAFDCVSHSILLQKLYMYNLHPSSCTLISSFLTNRYQVVKSQNMISKQLQLVHGVPQGSVLGPLLFLIFINDFPSYMNSKAILFADDTTLINENTSLDVAARLSEETQSNAARWFLANRLTLNTNKSENVLFTLKNYDKELELSTNVKFLGLNIDSQLCWKVHEEEVASKLTKNIFLLRNIADRVPADSVRTAYFALCQSHLTYGLIAWGHSSITQRLFRLQRRALRIVANIKYREDCRNQFIKYKIMTLPCLYIYQCLTYIKQNLNKYITHKNVHNYSTRKATNLCLQRLRLSKSQTGTGYFAIKFFNNLPMSIQKLNLEKYNETVKCYLISKAFYSFDEYLADKDICKFSSCNV